MSASNLVKGANAPLPSRVGALAIGAAWADVDLDIDIVALLCGSDRKALSDGHFLFWGQPASPDGVVHLRAAAIGEASPIADRAQVLLNLVDLDPSVAHIYIALATVADGQSLSGVTGLEVRVRDMAYGEDLVAYNGRSTYSTETCVNLAELYRRAGQWKVRIVDQGYSGGLSAFGRDHGVDIE